MAEHESGPSGIAPLVRRAALAAASEPGRESTVKVGVASGDWLVMTNDDTETGDRGRWIASDTYADCVLHR